MFSFLKKIFGGNEDEIQAALQNGAKVIDVRTVAEYSGGHVKGAINIPLSDINKEMANIKKMKKPIITCCASGVRSGNAMRILKSNGIAEVYNGGSWGKVQRLMS